MAGHHHTIWPYGAKGTVEFFPYLSKTICHFVFKWKNFKQATIASISARFLSACCEYSALKANSSKVTAEILICTAQIIYDPILNLQFF